MDGVMKQPNFLSEHAGFLLCMGIGLLALAAGAVVCSGWLLDCIFLPLGNYLHPEWDPPVNFLMPIHWLWATVMALFVTGILCVLIVGTRRIIWRQRD